MPTETIREKAASIPLAAGSTTVAGAAVPDSKAVAHRLPSLTGLRIFAALAVYFSHIHPPAGAPEPVRVFLASGYMGVTLFFVLSGFVLALNYFEGMRHPSARGVYDYAVARFARVYPLYIAVLGYLVVREHVYGGNTTAWWEHALALQAWDGNVDRAYRFNGPGWSIGVEFFLYACFPILVLALRRVRTPKVTLTVAAGVVIAMLAIVVWFVATGRGDLPIGDPGSAHRWLYQTPLLRLGDFALGILAALLYVQTKGRPGLARIGTPLAVIAALLIVALMAWPSHLYKAWSWDLSYALLAVVLIFGLAVAPASRLARVLSLPFIVLLGEASYAFYLVHQPAVGFLGAGRWNVDFSPATLLYEAMTISAVLCLAVGIHVMVERPARVYIRRWLSSRRGSAAVERT